MSVLVAESGEESDLNTLHNIECPEVPIFSLTEPLDIVLSTILNVSQDTGTDVSGIVALLHVEGNLFPGDLIGAFQLVQ